MVYKWYILPIGGLYGTYHLLREPGNSIDLVQMWLDWIIWCSHICLEPETPFFKFLFQFDGSKAKTMVNKWFMFIKMFPNHHGYSRKIQVEWTMEGTKNTPTKNIASTNHHHHTTYWNCHHVSWMFLSPTLILGTWIRTLNHYST